MKIAFIGGGNMASAIIQGIQAQPNSPYQVMVFDPNPRVVEKFEQQGLDAYRMLSAELQTAQVWVLAVKPQHMHEVLAGLAPWYQSSTIVMSVAAGISISTIVMGLQATVESAKIVRVMPNTPALIGMGASGVYATSVVSPAEKEIVDALLSAVGITAWLPQEKDIDAVTALSGSGPAYVYLMIESLVEAAKRLGLEESVAKMLAIATLKGASSLAEQSASSVQELRTQVTSKGGTTEAALAVLMPQLPQLIDTAMQAANQRAVELGSSPSDK